MEALQITLIVTDDKQIEKIEKLEERCKKIDLSLENIYAMTAMTMPYKPFIDVLLSLSNLELDDIERRKKLKEIFDNL